VYDLDKIPLSSPIYRPPPRLGSPTDRQTLAAPLTPTVIHFIHIMKEVHSYKSGDIYREGAIKEDII
jgi:hypothetical protein